MSYSLQTTKSLPSKYRHRGEFYQPYRFNHGECTEYGQDSNDKKGRLYVTRTHSGWKYHCHNCAGKFSGFQPKDGVSSPKETAEEILNTITNSIVTTDKVCLPDDMRYRLPMPGIKWLTKYGITEEEIKQYGIGYSPSMNRLIFPVYDSDGVLSAWQGRDLSGEHKIKYLTEMRKDIPYRVYYVPNDRNNKNLVIVEDIVSAIKVGRHTSSIALLGSYFNTSLIPKLRDREKIIFWLDEDKYLSSIIYARKARALGVNAISVKTLEDPKGCTDREIYLLTK